MVISRVLDDMEPGEAREAAQHSARADRTSASSRMRPCLLVDEEQLKTYCKECARVTFLVY